MAQHFLFCIAAALICAAQGSAVTFSFPPENDLEKKGETVLNESLIQLTPDTKTGLGWVTYRHRVPLENLANFTTHFQFSIRPQENQRFVGDGLAFFLAPFEIPPPYGGEGGFLGIFDSKNTSSYPMVAVEFDTYRQKWDPDDNHVGIDVNSIISKINVSVSGRGGNRTNRPENEDLKNGNQWDAWVDYDGGKSLLEVFLLYNKHNNLTKPVKPILSYNIDLRKFLRESVKVGLSAATIADYEEHDVTLWEFTSHLSTAVASTSAPPSHAPISTPPKNKKRSWEIALISSFVPFVAICVVILACWRYFWKRKVDTSAGDPDVELDEYLAQGPRRFAYAELAAATENFSEDNKLGQGGFGGVFKGALNGSPLAVKRISQGSKQGLKEYISEVTIINRLKHRNLVQLLGWCHQRDDFLLVYEYLPNGSLDRYIFEDYKDTLDWKQRYSIACDVASALVYLHQESNQRVVHRDVKASNVMLDSNFRAKLGDFGLARLMDRDGAASHTTVVAGTLGYLAPECSYTFKATPEADVFSFGAVTLEIACGRRPIDRTLDAHNCRLVEWVWDLHSQGKILDAVDQKFNGNFDHEEMRRLMGVGLLCSHPESKARPGMRQVLQILNSEAELPSIPSNYPVAVYNDDYRQRLCEITSTPMKSSITCGGSLSSTSSGPNAASPLLHAD